MIKFDINVDVKGFSKPVEADDDEEEEEEEYDYHYHYYDDYAAETPAEGNTGTDSGADSGDSADDTNADDTNADDTITDDAGGESKPFIYSETW